MKKRVELIMVSGFGTPTDIIIYMTNVENLVKGKDLRLKITYDRLVD